MHTKREIPEPSSGTLRKGDGLMYRGIWLPGDADEAGICLQTPRALPVPYIEDGSLMRVSSLVPC